MKKSVAPSVYQFYKGNRTAALLSGGLEARVLPNTTSWLQREVIQLCANARRSGCQPATALGMGCVDSIAKTIRI